MKSDIKDSKLFQEAEEITRLLLRPGTGSIVDATEVDVTPDGSQAVVAGIIVDKLDGGRQSRICHVDLKSGATRVLTFGPNTDRSCRFSPDGQRIAFLSDRRKAGDFQLYLLDPRNGEALAMPVVDGWIEYLHWSADGTRILLAVAGHGADAAGRHGAVSGKQNPGGQESWMPHVETGDDSFRRRTVWIYELASQSVRQVPATPFNIWEVNWCGPSALVAVVSHRADEGAWYAATLNVIDIESGECRQIYRPSEQLGWPSASPSGRQVAVVEAVCSDRWCVAGELLVIDVQSSAVSRIPTNQADVCSTRWRSDDRLLLGAHRGFEIAVLEYDVAKRALSDCWSSNELGAVGLYLSPVPFGQGQGDCVFIAEGYRTAPHIAVIQNGIHRASRSFNREAEEQIGQWLTQVERVTWTAPDGLEIQGWLLLPGGTVPFPLVLHVHGGPVASFRPQWQGRTGGLLANILLLKQGYAVFQPNPRGSSSRGQDFARKVKGDLNGADTYDYLSGLDSLVKRAIADPNRIGVTGVSYGGNMTCWLITQDQRFAAAVAAAPHSDQVSQHLMSNIPEFDELFLGAKYYDPAGKYYERSAIMHAHKARTPTLNIAGGLDRCTPPNQAVEFHNALRMAGVKSALVVYPEEGHGVRRYPAVMDCAARIVGWFEDHMPATKS